MIFLVGFMGSGKTAVGKALARRLQTRFVDLDSRIEVAAGCSIPEIFDRQGEAAFRDMEHRELCHLLGEPRNEAWVVALGGGAFAQPCNIEPIEKSGGLSVWLDAPAEVLLERCRQQHTTRPLARDPQRFLQLWRERLPFYIRAQLRVDATAPLDNVVEQILSALESSKFKV